MKAYDLLIQGEAGIIATTGYPGQACQSRRADHRSRPPRCMPRSGILLALYQSEKTGRGQVIDISMFESAVSWLGYFPHHYWHNGEEPARVGMRHQYITPYGPYLAGDGEYVSVASATAPDWEIFCRDVIRRPELLDDARFRSAETRRRHRDDLERVIEQIFLELPHDEWIRRLDASGLPYGQVNGIGEVLAHPQTVARQLVREVASPVGPVPIIASPLRLSASPVRFGPNPRSRGAHSHCAPVAWLQRRGNRRPSRGEGLLINPDKALVCNKVGGELCSHAMRGFSSDIRYALRTVRHGGISTVVAVLSLAVGVGANAAIFSVGYAMLARPLPYADADRLVMLRPTNPSHGVFWTTVAPANLLDWQAQAKSFEAIAGYRWRTCRSDRRRSKRAAARTPHHAGVLQSSRRPVDGRNVRSRRHSIRPIPSGADPRSSSAAASGSAASDRMQVFSVKFWTSTSSI